MVHMYHCGNKKNIVEKNKRMCYIINRGEIMPREEWISCPSCNGARVLKVRDDTVVHNLPIYCKKCRKESIISITSKDITIRKIR